MLNEKIKNRLIWLLLALLLLLFIAAALLHNSREPQPQQLAELFEQTINAGSYRFQMQAVLQLEETRRDYFNLTGAVNGDAAELSGTVLGSETALVFLDGTLYQRIGDTWYSHRLDTVESAAQLFAELLPTQAFAHGEISDCRWLGTDDSGRGRAGITAEASGWVAEYFRAPQYTLLLDKSGRQVQGLRLEAESRTGGGVLTVEAGFTDIGQPVGIVAPQ